MHTHPAIQELRPPSLCAVLMLNDPLLVFSVMYTSMGTLTALHLSCPMYGTCLWSESASTTWTVWVTVACLLDHTTWASLLPICISEAWLVIKLLQIHHCYFIAPLLIDTNHSTLETPETYSSHLAITIWPLSHPFLLFFFICRYLFDFLLNCADCSQHYVKSHPPPSV